MKDPSGAWGDLAAHYVGPASDGWELFEATVSYASYTHPPRSWRDLEFVVKYTVDGRTYWDNNLGRNYVVQR